MRAERAPSGTWQAYVRGDRDPEARAAWAEYIRARRKAKGQGTGRSRDELRYYEGPYGRRGFDQLTEQVLDVAAARTGRHWRDIVGRLVRLHGTGVTFPETTAAN